jgi:sortase A
MTTHAHPTPRFSATEVIDAARTAEHRRQRAQELALVLWMLERRRPRRPRRETAALASWLARLTVLLSRRNVLAALGTTLALIGFGHSGYVYAKAGLAQWLLRGAFARCLETGAPARPWPWADTLAVARLEVPRLGVDQIVLSSAAGRALAFGPALSSASAAPGAIGNTVISAHRDTHFRFMAELARGDLVWIETAEGRFAYRVEAHEVVDSRHARIGLAADAAHLTLVTCYPFEALLPGGPLRYVVSARLVARSAAAD